MNYRLTPQQQLRIAQLRAQIVARPKVAAPRFVPKPPRLDQVHRDGMAWLAALP